MYGHNTSGGSLSANILYNAACHIFRNEDAGGQILRIDPNLNNVNVGNSGPGGVDGNLTVSGPISSNNNLTSVGIIADQLTLSKGLTAASNDFVIDEYGATGIGVNTSKSYTPTTSAQLTVAGMLALSSRSTGNNLDSSARGANTSSKIVGIYDNALAMCERAYAGDHISLIGGYEDNLFQCTWR